jgi:integrase
MPVLTAAAIQKYKPRADRREIADSKAQGLFLIIQPSGTMSWAVRLRKPDGRTAKVTLGPVDTGDEETSDEPVMGGALTLGQARQLAAEIDRKRVRGVDVVEERKANKLRQRIAATDRAANSFGTCVREFFVDYRTKKRQTRPRRWRDDAAVLGLKYPPGSDPVTTKPEIIKGGLADIWADKPVAGIDSHDVHVVVDEARKHGSNGRARKLFAALSVLFGWLRRKRHVTINPVTGVDRPGPPASRERTLNDAEIVIFWQAAERVGGTFGALFKTLLLTGCRLREVSGMTRGEFGDDGVWEIPGTRTKNHRTLTLPLPQLALDVIASVPAIKSEAGFVFTTNGKAPVSGFSKAKMALDAEMAKIMKRAIAPWRVHDLRRTFASGLAALGVSLPVIERLLNHVSGSFGGIVSVYQKHEFAAEKAEALQRWALHLRGLVGDKPINVVDLTSRKQGR